MADLPCPSLSTVSTRLASKALTHWRAPQRVAKIKAVEPETKKKKKKKKKNLKQI